MVQEQAILSNLIRRSMAEFLGTALFVFVGVSSVSNIYAADPEAFQWDSPAHPPPAASAVIVALAFGLGYAGLMAATMAVRYVMYSLQRIIMTRVV